MSWETVEDREWSCVLWDITTLGDCGGRGLSMNGTDVCEVHVHSDLDIAVAARVLADAEEGRLWPDMARRRANSWAVEVADKVVNFRTSEAAWIWARFLETHGFTVKRWVALVEPEIMRMPVAWGWREVSEFNV